MSSLSTGVQEAFSPAHSEASAVLGAENRSLAKFAPTDIPAAPKGVPQKEYIVVEGALHGGQPCRACEKIPGQYANSERNMYDYIRDWINERF